MKWKSSLLSLLKLHAAMLLIFTWGACSGQTNKDSSAIPPKEDVKKEKANQIRTPQQMVDAFLQEENSKPKDSLMINMSLSDPRLDSVKLKALTSYYSYMNFGYQHRKNVFYWQLVSSEIIFFVVIGLVLIGVYFAWLQFYHTIKSGKKDGDTDKALSTELTASFKEIKIVSPVLGVIILIISFLFFYLYLRYVYPINELF